MGEGGSLGEILTETAHPGQAPIVTICMSYFVTGSLGREHRSNKPAPTQRVWERANEDAMCPTPSQNPSHWNPSLLSNMCTTRKDPESEQSE